VHHGNGTSGLPLTLAMVGVMAGVGLARRRLGSRYTVDDLERALRGQAGSTNTAGSKARTSASSIYLTLDPELVPDELLVGVLISGATKGDPVAVARKMISEADGDLSRLSRVIFRVGGVSQVGRARLGASVELARRTEYRSATSAVDRIGGADDAVRVLRSMATGPNEKLVGLYVDRRMRVIGTRVLSVGNMGHTIVDPRSVLLPAMEMNAYGVVLAHQHPSGDPQPSNADVEVSKRVGEAAAVLGMELIDHVVVAANRHRSLRELGLYDPPRKPGIMAAQGGVSYGSR